jgi:hypothetical protein
MYAQILVESEMEELVGRVTGAVVTALADLAAGLEDPDLRAAMGALVVSARQQLALAPVDPEPLVLAILHGDPVPVDVPVEVPGPPRLAAPAYWPAVPAISDRLFAQHAANSLKEAIEHLPGLDGNPQVPQATDQEHASGSPIEPASGSTPEPASDSHVADAPGPEPVPIPIQGQGQVPVQGGPFHPRPRARRKKSRQR